MSPEEAAFYDALAKNETATDVMGNEQLRIIAAEIVKIARQNASTDW